MIFEQDSNIELYATFVDPEGQAAVVSGTPTVSVFHKQAGSLKEDVVNQNMSLVSGTTYSYKWRPTARAYKGGYVAKYSVVYSGSAAASVGEETFQVVNRDFYSKVAGGFVNRGARSIGIWTESEKEQVLGSLLKLTTKIPDMSNIERCVEDEGKVLSELNQKLTEAIGKQHERLSNIDDALIELQDSVPEYAQFDDSKIVSEVKKLRDNLSEFKDLNKSLRIPTIISELEDLKLGIEHFQEDLCKVLPTRSLSKGVGLSEEA